MFFLFNWRLVNICRLRADNEPGGLTTIAVGPTIQRVGPLQSRYCYIPRQLLYTAQQSTVWRLAADIYYPDIWGLLLRYHFYISTATAVPTPNHDYVIKWKHFQRYKPFVRGIQQPPVNSPHKVQWRGALMFSLICAWTTGWVNNRDTGDLRRHRAHYDVIVMMVCGNRTRDSTTDSMCNHNMTNHNEFFLLHFRGPSGHPVMGNSCNSWCWATIFQIVFETYVRHKSFKTDTHLPKQKTYSHAISRLLILYGCMDNTSSFLESYAYVWQNSTSSGVTCRDLITWNRSRCK